MSLRHRVVIVLLLQLQRFALIIVGTHLPTSEGKVSQYGWPPVVCLHFYINISNRLTCLVVSNSVKQEVSRSVSLPSLIKWKLSAIANFQQRKLQYERHFSGANSLSNSKNTLKSLRPQNIFYNIDSRNSILSKKPISFTPSTNKKQPPPTTALISRYFWKF